MPSRTRAEAHKQFGRWVVPRSRWGKPRDDPGFTVYLLWLMPGPRVYIGLTRDLAARITAHRNGKGANDCKHFRITEVEKRGQTWDREEALDLERKIYTSLRIRWPDVPISMGNGYHTGQLREPLRRGWYPNAVQ